MKSTFWNPQQYEKFKSQRAKPFHDLVHLIEKAPFHHVVDLGCGTGELTRALFDELKPTAMTGIDSSLEMLSKATNFATTGLNFQALDIANYAPPEKLDLVFSNAALQWLPEHEVLFPKILNWISEGGQVAIQVPLNFDHPSHIIAAETAAKLFPDIFGGAKIRSVLSLERYAEILFQHGFKDQVARIEVYGHPMESGRDVIEWTKGTLLTSYQAKLTQEQFSIFIKTYESALLQVIGEGPYFYAFKRLLLWGKKNA